MKKLILSALACTALVISSCNQNSPAPAPAAPTPAPTSSMTATEALLVGDWIWDKTETYQSGNLSVTQTPLTQDAIGNIMYGVCHMVLKSSFYNGAANTNTAGTQYYNGDFYTTPSSASGPWNVGPLVGGNTLTLGNYTGILIPFFTPGNINTLNATTLICQSWTPGQIANGYKCYYHK